MIRHISNKLNKEFLWKKIHNCNVSTGSAGGNNNSWNSAVSLTLFTKLLTQILKIFCNFGP